MKYVCVIWDHNFLDEPIEIYSELDDCDWEVRKLEIYPNGTATFADMTHSMGSSMLSLIPFPQLNEISSQPEFEAHEISASKFDELWDIFVSNSN